MTLNQFFKKYIGKKVDFDNAYGAQCVDLIKFYYRDVFGIKAHLGHAWSYQYGYDPKKFRWIKNTIKAVPRAGDVVVWDKRFGTYGHVAIATGAGTWLWFNSVEQNYPAGSPVHVRRHNYFGVSGWLRPLAFEKKVNVAQSKKAVVKKCPTCGQVIK